MRREKEKGGCMGPLDDLEDKKSQSMVHWTEASYILLETTKAPSMRIMIGQTRAHQQPRT